MISRPTSKRLAAGVALAAIIGACSGSDARSPAAPSLAAELQSGIRTFKVATWNIRSGMGIRGFTTTSWSHDTLNCTDRSKPLNAWGIGLPQAELERIKADPAVVALAVQEAWNCAFPQHINGVLGFKTASGERNGTALLARYGLSGPVKYHQIDARANQWLVGGDVCLDAGCSATLPMYSVHFGDTTSDGVPVQAQRVLDLLAAHGGARLFMGDLNVHRTDTWNPRVPCTADDNPDMSRTIGMIEGAGYADAWKATQSSEGWTGMASRPGCGSPLGNLYKRIDYVYSSGLRTLSTDRFARTAPGTDAPSDHVGLIAELLFTPPRGAQAGDNP